VTLTGFSVQPWFWTVGFIVKFIYWMDYPTVITMKTRELALVAVFSATCLAMGYGRGLALPFFPGGIEFMSVIIFVSGFSFGWLVGGLNGALTLAIYMLVPYPFAHPAAWLFTVSPVLLVVMAGLGALFGLVGGFLGGRHGEISIRPRFVAEMALSGFLLTFLYDVLSSVGFYLAYPGIYPSVWEAIYLTFIPLWLPYPPIVHTFTNTIVFALVAPPLIKAIKDFPGIVTKKPSS